MRLPSLAVLLVASSLVSGCAARSRMGDAVVEQREGKLCFSLEDTIATRRDEPRLRAIVIQETTTSAKKAVWAFRMPPQSEGELFSPPACVPYGSAPQEAIVMHPSQELAPGVIYSVSINARGNDGTNPTFVYSAEFCLLRNPDQSIRVHQVQWDAKANKWRREVCQAP